MNSKTGKFVAAGMTLAGALAVLSACGGGGSTSSTGTMRLYLTDNPGCFESVFVTVSKIRVHQSANAGENDAGWSEVALVPPRRIDLLTLQNGILENLGQTALPAGKYTQMRLVLGSNGNTQPYANAVVTNESEEIPLKTPSGQQSGLKMNVNIDIPVDTIADFVLDFDACKSVVTTGKSGYNLKPVVSVIPLLADGRGQRIEGYVASGVASAAKVTVQASGVVAKATVPDPLTGKFVLYPVWPSAGYNLVITAADRATTVITGVPAGIDGPTLVSSNSVPVDPPVSTTDPATRTADGTVSVSGSLANTNAGVRALQQFTAGPLIEVDGMQVDDETGAYSFALPLAAPVKTVYSPSPTAFSFSADAAVAAQYRLEAAVPVYSPKTADIDLTTSDATTGFVFP